MKKRTKKKTEKICAEFLGIPYTLCHSSARKTVVLTLKDSKVSIYAPFAFGLKEAELVVSQNIEKIKLAIEKGRKRSLDESEIEELKQKGSEIFLPLTKEFSKMTGLVPSNVRLTEAEGYLGCCNPKNVISYSYKLAQYPMFVIEYVVLHELAHIKYKNHKKEFYSFIESFMPDYRERKREMRSFAKNLGHRG